MSGIEPVGTKHKIAMRIKEMVLNLESIFILRHVNILLWLQLF